MKIEWSKYGCNEYRKSTSCRSESWAIKAVVMKEIDVGWCKHDRRPAISPHKKGRKCCVWLRRRALSSTYDCGVDEYSTSH